MKTFAEFLTEALDNGDLGVIFDELNDRMFDATRKLPRDLPIKFATTPKGVAGLCEFKFSNATRMTIPHTVNIRISSLVKNKESLYKVVAHEMIHARLALDNNKERGHGPFFTELAKHLSKKVGFDIPLDHEFTEDDIAAIPLKRVAAYIATRPDNSLSIILFSENSVNNVISYVEKLARYNIDNKRVKDAWFGVIETRLYKFYPVVRSEPKSSYILSGAELKKYAAELKLRQTQFFHMK